MKIKRHADLCMYVCHNLTFNLVWFIWFEKRISSQTKKKYFLICVLRVGEFAYNLESAEFSDHIEMDYELNATGLGLITV